MATAAAADANYLRMYKQPKNYAYCHQSIPIGHIVLTNYVLIFIKKKPLMLYRMNSSIEYISETVRNKAKRMNKFGLTCIVLTHSSLLLLFCPASSVLLFCPEYISVTTGYSFFKHCSNITYAE